MSKRKRAFAFAAILLLVGIFTYSSLQQQMERERKHKWQIAEDIGLYVLNGVADGQFQVGESYAFSQMDPSQEVVQRALSQSSFHSVYLVEEDVALIMGEPLFQSISGYLVTTGERELPAQYETGLRGLDAGGQVHTGKITEHLYGWTGGL